MTTIRLGTGALLLLLAACEPAAIAFRTIEATYLLAQPELSRGVRPQPGVVTEPEPAR